MMSGGEGKVVCVTGASGFIASSLIQHLLQNGYTVRATVRNLGDPTKLEHLKELEGANQRLGLFQADLAEEGSFDAAVEGCCGVFHTASPSPLAFGNIKDPQAQIIKPAVNGALNFLRSCLKAPSIKRVVFTSSMVAVNVSRNAMMNNSEVEIDETWYSDPVFCEEIEGWYHLSKTLAEEAAWKFAKEHDIDLVVINPGFTIGRCLQPTLNDSSNNAFLELILHGKCDFLCFGVVDVKDVVHAHVLAFENPSANGRYCVAAAMMQIPQVFDMLHQLYPTLALPKIDGDNTTTGKLNKISREKAESLGVNFTPIEESFKDFVEFLKERNLLLIP